MDGPDPDRFHALDEEHRGKATYALWPGDYSYPFWGYGGDLAYDYGDDAPAYGYGCTSDIYGGVGH